MSTTVRGADDDGFGLRWAYSRGVYSWRTLRPRSCQHLVRMDRGGTPGPSDQPHAMGHRGASFWCGRFAPAALRHEQGSCLETPRLDWAGGDRARRRCPRVARERGPDVGACGACGRSVSRGHAAGGGASCRDHPARAFHGCEEDWFCADPARCRRHRVGCGRRHRGPGRASGTCCFLGPPWRGPATRSRCVTRGWMGCTPRASPPPAPCFSMYPSIFSWRVRSLANAPWGDLALQAFVQGLLTAIASLVFYGRAVSILGASSGAAFAALSPAMTAVMAIPILGEWPAAMDWIAIVCISVGVYVVSGGPLPQRRS